MVFHLKHSRTKMLKLVTVAGRQHVNLLGAPAKFIGYQPQRFIGLMFQHWFDRTFNRVGTLKLYILMPYVKKFGQVFC